MSGNLIGEIFDEINGYSLKEPVKSEEIRQNLADQLFRIEVEKTCIFLQEQEFCNENSKQSEFYKWYDVYFTDYKKDETVQLLTTTKDFFSKLNIEKPTKQGLVYDMRIGGTCDKNIGDLDKLAKEVIANFQEDQNCKLNNWLSDFIQNVGKEDAKNIIHKIDTIFKKYGKKSPVFFENILSHHINIVSFFVVEAMEKEEQYFYSEETILKLEQHLLEIYKNNLQDSVSLSSVESYFNIILKNILDNRSVDSTHILFLSQLVSNIDYYSKFANKIADRLYEDLKDDDINIALYPKAVFENFSMLLEDGAKFNEHEPVLALLGEAYLKDIYPMDDDLFKLFEGIFESNSKYRTLSFDVICKYLSEIFNDDIQTIEFITEKINNIQNTNYQLPDFLIKKIITFFSKNTGYFVDNIVHFIENRHSSDTEVLNYLLEVVTNLAEDNNFLTIKNPKDIIFIFKRLHETKIELTDRALAIFSKFLFDDNFHVQKLSNHLFNELNQSYILTGVQTLFLRNSDDIVSYKESRDITEKRKYISSLSKSVNEYNADKLEKIFKDALLQLDKPLKDASLLGLEECKKYKEITFSELEEEVRLASGDTSIYTVEIIKNKLPEDVIIIDSVILGLDIESSKIQDYVSLYQLLYRFKFGTVSQIREFLEVFSNYGYGGDWLDKVMASEDNSLLISELYWYMHLKALPEELKPYQEIIKDFIVIGFSDKEIQILIKKLNKDNIQFLEKAIERINNYSTNSIDIQREGYNLKDIFIYKAPEEWVFSIKDIYDYNNYFVEYDKDNLIKKLVANNDNKYNAKVQNLARDHYFDQILDDIEIASEKLHYSIEFVFDKFTTFDKKNHANLFPLYGQIFLSINDEIRNITEEDSYIFPYLQKIFYGYDSVKNRDYKKVYKYLANIGYKDLDLWDKNDYLAWMKGRSGKVDDKNIAEVMAVLKTAAYKTLFHNKYYPRDVQIISLLSLFKSEDGRIIEVTTGEGKSVIIALFAALNVINGHKVDIVTSSVELAIRDSRDQEAFFDLLGITSGHNARDSSVKKKCYLYDVVYGDLLHFIGDDLRDIDYGTKYGRGYGIIIADEVDNLLIDLNSMMVRLSSSTPGFFYLQQILIYLWTNNPNARFVTRVKMEADKTLGKNMTIEDSYKYLTDHYQAFANKNLLNYSIPRNNRAVILPKQLDGFAIKQLDNWIESVLTAMSFKKNNQYIIKKPESDVDPRHPDSVRRVSTVDVDNGSINPSLQWSNGLYQLLSIENGALLTPENLVGVFMTYVGYFSKYKGSIFGLTGTLGTETHQDFLHKLFGVDFAVIPTYKEKKLVIYPEIITQDENDWYDKVIENIKKRSLDDSRATLVIMKTIEEVELLIKKLKDVKDLKIIKYIYGTDKERVEVEEKEISKNAVIISTNLAGRGSDIKITKEVEKNGGLHVIFSFYSESIRVLLQGYGRAARKGESGSAQLIVNNELWPECDNSNCLDKKRDENEIKKFKRESLCELPNINLQDNLFTKFRRLLANIISPIGYAEVVVGNSFTTEMKPKKLYIHAVNESDIFLNALTPNQYPIGLKIDEEIKKLDPEIYQHILKVIEKKLKNAALNQQDLKLIYYIAAKNDLMYPEREPIFTNFGNIIKIVNRVYNKTINGCNAWEDCYIKKMFSDGQISYLKNRINVTVDDLEKGLSKLNLDDNTINDYSEIFKYAIWKRYLEIYNQEIDIYQVKAKWEMWLYNQSTIFDTFLTKCDENKEEEVSKLLHGLKINLFNKFYSFADDIKKNYKTKGFFDNQKLMVDKAFFLHDLQYSEFTKIFNKVDSIKSGNIKDLIDIFYNGHRRENLLSRALLTTGEAVSLDEELAWPAYQARAIMRLQEAWEFKNIREFNDGNVALAQDIIQNTLEDFYGCLDKLDEVIAQYDSPYITLSLYKKLKPSQELMAQYVYQKRVFMLMRESIVKAIEVVNKAIKKSNGETFFMVRVDKSIDLYELTTNMNSTEAFEAVILNNTNFENLVNSTSDIMKNNLVLKNNNFIKEFVASQMGQLGFVAVTLVEYELTQPDDDWWGTLFSAVLGGFQIFVGFALIGAGGIFLPSLGLSMIIGGLGDIISSLISVVEGKPIDIDTYFKGKAVSYAVAIVTAGIMSGFSKSTEILTAAGPKTLGEATPTLAKATSGEIFQYAAGINAVGIMLNVAARYAGKQYVKSNQGDATAEATNTANLIVSTFELELMAIFVGDKLDENPNSVTFGNLKKDANDVIMSCNKRFNNIPAAVGKSTLNTMVGLGGNPWAAAAAGFAVDMTMGMIKYSDYSSEFEDKYGNIIRNHANRARESLKTQGISKLYETKLLSRYDQERYDYIMGQLRKSNFIKDGNLDYRNCNQIDTIEIVDYKAAIDHGNMKRAASEACKEIYEEFKREKESLRMYILQNIKGGMTSTLLNEISTPAFNHLGHYLYKKIPEWYNEIKKGKFANDNQKPKEEKKPQGIKLQGKRKAEEEAVNDGTPGKKTATQNPPSNKKHPRSTGSSPANCPGDGAGVCSAPREAANQNEAKSDDANKQANQNKYPTKLNKISIHLDMEVDPDTGKVTSKIGHAIVELQQGDNEPIFRGQNPKKHSPIYLGKIKDEKVRYESSKKVGTVVTKTFYVGDEHFSSASKKVVELENNPQFYIAHFGHDCIDFAQQIYLAAGQKGDFFDLFTKQDLQQPSGTSWASVSADMRYGTGDSYRVVKGVSREAVAKEHNVDVERVEEPLVDCLSAIECHNQMYTIKPIKKK